MNAAKFIVTAGPVGLIQCMINGEDVLEKVAGVQLNITDGQPTEVFLRQAPGATGTIEGEGIVYLETAGVSFRQFLADVDLEQLEAQIMEEQGWGSEQSLVAAVVNKLIELSNGA